MNMTNLWEKPEILVDPAQQKLDESDIIEAHRYIYLFFDANDIANEKAGIYKFPGEFIYGKAIQINLSISKGGGNNIDIMPWIRGSNNSTYMTMNLYTYSTIFEHDIRNFRSAEFTLDTSLSSSTTNDYDIKKVILNGASLYLKDIRQDDNKKEFINNSMNVNAPRIPEPMYYTMKQMEMEQNEIYCLTTLYTTVTHLGNELIDNFTRLSIMDIMNIDSMNLAIRNKMKDISHSIRSSDYNIKMFDTNEFSSNMLFQDIESMQNGFIYMYDTDLGQNIRKSNQSIIPFGKYQMENKMTGDLQRTLDTVSAKAKQMERDFGHVRIQYSPMYYGNKLDVYFKDYNPENQPVIKEEVKVDNGTRIFDEISERLSETEDPDDYDTDFNMDIFDSED